jgi:hypothetical protein
MNITTPAARKIFAAVNQFAIAHLLLARVIAAIAAQTVDAVLQERFQPRQLRLLAGKARG